MRSAIAVEPARSAKRTVSGRRSLVPACLAVLDASETAIPLGDAKPKAASGPQQTSDEHPLDLGGAFLDLVDLDVAPVARHWVVLHEAVSAVDLDRVIGRAL